VRDARVLAAVAAVPRELFVPDDVREHAYADAALPLGEGQTISQPTVVARMAELAAPSADGVVLEVGGGSGYAAAVLAQLCRLVVTVERLQQLAEGARAALTQAGAENVEVVVADGCAGLPERAPFDAIIVSAATRRAPAALLEQLADGGRLVLPLGARRQVLVRVTRSGAGLRQEVFERVRFVPLICG